jgi:hypothetical protein
MYAEQGDTKVDLRDQFLGNLQWLIIRFQQEGHDIVLMIDANEGSDVGSGIDKMIYRCGLADAHKTARLGLEYPATYQ